MGIVENLIRLTPFYDQYKKNKKKRAEIFQEKLEAKYLPHRIAFYKQFLKPDDLVFDVGANEGNRVLPFLECGANVIAVEPQPSCVNILNARFGNKIRVENVGLSDSVGELEMLLASDSTVSSFSEDYVNKTKDRFEYSKWEGKIMVPVTTLDQLISKHGVPAFCKIDVEGFELQVLKGLHSKIPMLSIEYCIPEMRNELIKCLERYNLIAPQAMYNYSVGESMAWGMDSWKSYQEFLNHVDTDTFAKTSFGDIYIKSV